MAKLEETFFFSYIDESKAVTVNITDGEFAWVKDDNGGIWFATVMEFCIPRFDSNNGGVNNGPVLTFWEWQAAHMGNYMLNLIEHHGFKPKYYVSVNPIYILPHHTISHLYGVKTANMLCANGSINHMYSTTEYFDSISPVKESVPQDALKDLI